MASDAQRIRDAAARYGRSLDPVAARYTNPVTGKRLSGEALILKTISGESGGRRDAVSKAGARAWAQFMPGTRASFIKEFGVDAWRSPEEAVHALTLHMRGKGGHPTGLEGYNPGGGQGYVNYILGQRVGGGRGSAPRGGGGGGGGGGGAVSTTGGGRATTGASSGSSPASPFSPGPLSSGLALKLEQAPSISTAGPAIPSGLRPRYYQDVPSFGPPIPPADPSLPDASGQAVSFGEPAAPGVHPAAAAAAHAGAAAGSSGPTVRPATASGGAQTALAWVHAKLKDPGSRETSENQGPLASFLNKRFGFNGAAWCAMFTSAAVTKGGAPTSARTASVAQVRAKAKAGQGYNRVSSQRARPGDLILFGDQHIGMVDSVRNGRISYIGGNQSDTVSRGSAPVAGADVVRPQYARR